MFDRIAFNNVANVNASNVVDLRDVRARLATGQPAMERRMAPVVPSTEPPIGVGDWVRTASGIIGFIQQTYIDDDGIPRAILTNGSGIRQSHAIRTLALFDRPHGLPAPVPVREGC